MFQYRIPKTRMGKWRIDKLSFNDDKTACETVTTVQKTMPGMGATFDWPLTNRWVLEEGEWFLTIPWTPDKNPMLDIMRAQVDVFQQTEGLRQAPEPAKAPVPPGTQRLRPDPQNPVVLHAGEKGVFRFHHQNAGAAPIRVLSVYSDCHCTAIETDTREVPPGESGTISVVLDTFGLPLGLVQKQISVQFSDLPDPLVLNLSVNTLPNFALSPPSVDLGDIDRGVMRESMVTLKNQSGRQVRLQTVLRTDPRLDMSLPAAPLEPGGEAGLTIRFTPGESGDYLGSLTLQTDLEAEPLIAIPVRARVK
jgi:hypothetical protein